MPESPEPDTETAKAEPAVCRRVQTGSWLLSHFLFISRKWTLEIRLKVSGTHRAERNQRGEHEGAVLTEIWKTSCVSSSICTLMGTCLPGGWAGGRTPGSNVDTPKLSGAPSLCPAVDGLSAGSTMATVRGFYWRLEEEVENEWHSYITAFVGHANVF